MPTVLLLVSVLLVVAALAACQPVAAPDASAPVVTSTLAMAPLTAPNAAGDWQRMKQAGRMIVGTSADFPPFEYIDHEFRFAGYDPALITALGKRLGVEVVLKDFALEGLEDALALGQIDVAAAALTVTPERAAVVDFTQPYFATSEGVLAQPGADAGAVAALDDLAGLRIGIERGSVYESWLRRMLVDTGLSTAQDLMLYTNIDAAAADLAGERIDLVITDLPAAQQLARQHGLLLAGQGLLAQKYALAVRQGADELRAQLDAALAALAADGTLSRLAQQQPGFDSAQSPTPGQPPENDATTPAADQASCINGLAWLEDLSLPDQGMTTPAVMAPAQPFTKAWRVLNTGTCTWDSRYELVFAHGNAAGAGLGGQPARVAAGVAPGESTELVVALIAPITPGVYQGSWQVQNAAGRAFGERLRVGIQVAGVPTPTPAPTQTPVAGIRFAADAERVLQGSPITFSWDVEVADEVYFYQAGQGGWNSHQVEAQGEASVIPNATTTYQLRVVRDGQAEDRLLTVYVEPNPALPQMVQFVVVPKGEVALGQCVTITWRIEGDVEQVALFRNKELLWEEAPVEGVLEDCPTAIGEVEYAAGAQGGGGRNYAVETVRVVENAPPSAQAGPMLDRFSVLPESLTVGGCVDIQWTVSSPVANIQIRRDEGVLVDGAAATGSGSDCPSKPGLRQYQLVASDADGQTSIYAVNVWVTVPASTPVAAAAPSDATADGPPVPGQATPAGHEFLLISYRNAAGELVSPLTGTQVLLALGGDGSVSGHDGCNQYSSRYQQDGTALTIAPVEVTEMFCAEPIGLVDQVMQYLAILPATAAYVLEAGQLTLLDGAGNPVAIYITVR